MTPQAWTESSILAEVCWCGTSEGAKGAAKGRASQDGGGHTSSSLALRRRQIERCTQVVLDVGTANEGRICFVGWAGRSLGGYLVSVSTIPVWIVSDSDGHWVVPTEMPMYRLRTRGSFLLFDTGFGEMSLQMQLPKLLVDTCPAHCGL